MSSYRHRLESESDSDASEEFPAPKHNNVRQYTPISDISDVDIPESSHSSDTISGKEPDYGNLRIPLAKQNSNSQVGRLASKCNVPQLRKILAEYDVRGLSKMRKDILVKSSIEAYDTLDPTRRHQLLESLSDPTGKERTVSSTIHGSPARNMRGAAKPVKKKRKTDDVWMKPRQPGSSRWQMPADDEDDEEEEEGEVRDGPASRAGRRRLVIDEGNRQADSDSSFKSPSDSDTSESGSGSRSEAETVRGKGITVSAQKRVMVPSRPSLLPVDKPGSFTISPPPNRPRIMLTLPKTPKPTDAALPAELNDPSPPAQQRTNFPFNQVMRINTTSGPPSPYVPRNNPQGSANLNEYSAVPPPQTPSAEPVDNARKRIGQGNLVSFPSAGSSGIPPPLKNLPSFALPRNSASASPFPGHSGPPHSSNGFGSPGHTGRREWTFDYRVNSRTSSTSSEAGSSRNDQAPGVGQMAQYPPMYGGSGTIPHDYFATAMAQDVSGPSSGGPQPTRYYTGSSNNPQQQQQRGDPRDPRTGFQSASRFFDPTMMQNPARHSSHHSGSQMPAQQAHQFPTQYHSTTPSTLSQAAQNLTRIAPMPQATPGGSSSVMANNPFAAVFAGPKVEVDPETQGRMEGDEKKQMVFKVVKQGPGVRTPAPPTPQYGAGRVIKPTVFHQILAEITPPISIRREPSMTSRGVYREIITTFGFDQSHKQMHSPDHLILMRFCQESLNRPAYEMHPDNLKLMLNGKTLVEPAVVDFSNRMKKKKNPVYNQPIEVPLQFLVGQNVVLARWTEDANQPAAPGMPAVPDEPPKDYFLIVEYARRKTMDEILAAAMVNKIPVADTVHKLYLALGGGDNDDIRADSQKISLLCPASRGRLVVPIRGRNCDHVECFDASSFLYMNKMAKARWTCPKCNKSVQFDDIVLDEFTQRLLESFPNSENIEATFENDNIVVRESQKPQKGSGSSADVASTSEPSRSSASTPGAAVGSSSGSTTKAAPSTSRAPPEVITLD